MDAFILLLSFFCFSIGISGFVLSVFLFARYNNRILLLYSITMGLWSVNFFVIRILDILQLQFWNIAESSCLFTALVSNISWSGFTFFVLLTIATISRQGLRKWEVFLLAFLSLFLLLPLESSLLSFLPKNLRTIFHYLQIIFHFAVLYWAAFLLKSTVSSISKKNVRRTYHRLVLLLFVFYPILALELLPFTANRFPFGLGIYPVFYLLVNVFFLRFISHFIYFPKLDRKETLKSDTENVYSLTKREWEIAELLISGKSYPQIAEELFIALETVKSHVSNIYGKASVSGKIELMAALRKK